LSVAADDEMAAVFQSLPTAPVDFREKGRAPDNSLHVAHLPFEHAAAPRIARCKDAAQPGVGIDSIRESSHEPSLPDPGKRTVTYPALPL
jgi:hypothetical protein